MVPPTNCAMYCTECFPVKSWFATRPIGPSTSIACTSPGIPSRRSTTDNSGCTASAGDTATTASCTMQPGTKACTCTASTDACPAGTNIIHAVVEYTPLALLCGLPNAPSATSTVSEMSKTPIGVRTCSAPVAATSSISGPSSSHSTVPADASRSWNTTSSPGIAIAKVYCCRRSAAVGRNFCGSDPCPASLSMQRVCFSKPPKYCNACSASELSSSVSPTLFSDAPVHPGKPSTTNPT